MSPECASILAELEKALASELGRRLGEPSHLQRYIELKAGASEAVQREVEEAIESTPRLKNGFRAFLRAVGMGEYADKHEGRPFQERETGPAKVISVVSIKSTHHGLGGCHPAPHPEDVAEAKAKFMAELQSFQGFLERVRQAKANRPKT